MLHHRYITGSLEQERQQTYAALAMLATQRNPFRDLPTEHLRSQGVALEGSRVIVMRDAARALAEALDERPGEREVERKSELAGESAARDGDGPAADDDGGGGGAATRSSTSEPDHYGHDVMI